MANCGIGIGAMVECGEKESEVKEALVYPSALD